MHLCWAFFLEIGGKVAEPGWDHVPNRLIEGLHLLGLEVADDGVDPTQQLIDERHHLTHLKKKFWVKEDLKTAYPLDLT